MRTTADLRAAYQYLADTAPAVENLHFSAAGLAPQSPRLRRTWLAVAVAAVAVIVAAIFVAVRTGAGHRGLQPATNPIITCMAPSGNPATAQQDRPVIESRLAALGRSGSVSIVANGTGLRIAFKNQAPVDASAMCTNAVLQVRPVVSADRGPCLQTGSTPTNAVCAPNDLRLVLGPTILEGTDITSAMPQPPDATTGATGWTIALRLGAKGQRAWSAYTTAHNLGTRPQPAGGVTTCAPNRVPCADYAAFVVDGQVLAVPLTLAPSTGGVTQLYVGDSTPLARSLSARLNRLPVPMELYETMDR